MKARVSELIKVAISTGDGRLAGGIVDRLRLEKGYTYVDCFEVFRRNAPNPDHFGLPDFEALMADAEDMENKS